MPWAKFLFLTTILIHDEILGSTFESQNNIPYTPLTMLWSQMNKLSTKEVPAFLIYFIAIFEVKITLLDRGKSYHSTIWKQSQMAVLFNFLIMHFYIKCWMIMEISHILFYISSFCIYVDGTNLTKLNSK